MMIICNAKYLQQISPIKVFQVAQQFVAHEMLILP